MNPLGVEYLASRCAKGEDRHLQSSFVDYRVVVNAVSSNCDPLDPIAFQQFFISCDGSALPTLMLQTGATCLQSTENPAYFECLAERGINAGFRASVNFRCNGPAQGVAVCPATISFLCFNVNQASHSIMLFYKNQVNDRYELDALCTAGDVLPSGCGDVGTCIPPDNQCALGLSGGTVVQRLPLTSVAIGSGSGRTGGRNWGGDPVLLPVAVVLFVVFPWLCFVGKQTKTL